MYEEQSIEEIKFNYFLNKTIYGASKRYWEKQKRLQMREIQIIDNEDYEQYLNKYVDFEQNAFELKDVNDLYEALDSESLINAVKSLTEIERLVIFLWFIQSGKRNEIATMLNMHPKSITRIRNRAISKMKKYLKGADIL